MRLIKYLRSIVFLVLGILLLYVLLGLTLSVMSTNVPILDCENEYEVYIASNGIHLDIFIPVDQLSQKILLELEIPVETRFVAFGWGDKQFYLETPTWADMRLSVAIKALLVRGPAAMHVSFCSRLTNAGKSLALCEWQHN